MSEDRETIFSAWSKPPSDTEQDRCENAERATKNAIASSSRLNRRDIRVFAQGSYQNNTNVRRDSDVDIAVVCYDVFFPRYPPGTSAETFEHEDAKYLYNTFKNEVEEALVQHFGRRSVTRGNKAFNLKENSYHVEADVAPFFEHRRYHTDGSYLSGVELRPDNNKFLRVINWPRQHYENGVEKNKATRRCFKSVVRIIKSLCNHMTQNGIVQAKPITGFLIECLIWNVPNDYFGYSTWTEHVNASLGFLFNNTLSDEMCSEWGEVSELIYLFREGKKWTRQQAHDFISAAWDYVGFE